jgi:hypothetical protein
MSRLLTEVVDGLKCTSPVEWPPTTDGGVLTWPRSGEDAAAKTVDTVFRSTSMTKAITSVPNGRSAGTMSWGGMTQILPFADPRVVKLYGQYERAVYGALAPA